MAVGDTLAVLSPLGYEFTATNYAQIVSRNLHPVLAFDDTTQEAAVWSSVMPQHYGGGDIKVLVTWLAAATSGTVGWDATFENDASQDIDSDGFATAQTITAATVAGTSGVKTTTSVTCAHGSAGTDSIAAGDPFRLRIRRDVANDSAVGDAQIMLVELREA